MACLAHRRGSIISATKKQLTFREISSLSWRRTTANIDRNSRVVRADDQQHRRPAHTRTVNSGKRASNCFVVVDLRLATIERERARRRTNRNAAAQTSATNAIRIDRRRCRRRRCRRRRLALRSTATRAQTTTLNTPAVCVCVSVPFAATTDAIIFPTNSQGQTK